jgi:hypothetical protein
MGLNRLPTNQRVPDMTTRRSCLRHFRFKETHPANITCVPYKISENNAQNEVHAYDIDRLRRNYVKVHRRSPGWLEAKFQRFGLRELGDVFENLG